VSWEMKNTRVDRKIRTAQKGTDSIQNEKEKKTTGVLFIFAEDQTVLNKLKILNQKPQK